VLESTIAVDLVNGMYWMIMVAPFGRCHGAGTTGAVSSFQRGKLNARESRKGDGSGKMMDNAGE
jgi:hypothetical protein